MNAKPEPIISGSRLPTGPMVNMASTCCSPSGTASRHGGRASGSAEACVGVAVSGIAGEVAKAVSWGGESEPQDHDAVFRNHYSSVAAPSRCGSPLDETDGDSH